MNCTEASELIGSYVDDDLPEETVWRLGRHLFTCRACTYEVETQRMIKNRLRDGIGEEVASDAFRSRVLSRLRADNPHLAASEAEPVDATQYRLPIGI